MNGSSPRQKKGLAQFHGRLKKRVEEEKMGRSQNSLPNKAADEKMSCKLESAITKSNGDKCIEKDTISITLKRMSQTINSNPLNLNQLTDKANKVNVNNNKGDGGISTRSAQLMKSNTNMDRKTLVNNQDRRKDDSTSCKNHQDEKLEDSDHYDFSIPVMKDASTKTFESLGITHHAGQGSSTDDDSIASSTDESVDLPDEMHEEVVEWTTHVDVLPRVTERRVMKHVMRSHVLATKIGERNAHFGEIAMAAMKRNIEVLCPYGNNDFINGLPFRIAKQHSAKVAGVEVPVYVWTQG